MLGVKQNILLSIKTPSDHEKSKEEENIEKQFISTV